LFSEWNKAGSPGCSVGISRNGSVVYTHGYGMASVELGVPITPQTVIAAASISKQFTAMSILLLAERGKLSLDDDVSKYVPDWADHTHHVTIRHLLTHTSGLREGFLLLGWAHQSPFEDYNEAIARMIARQRGVASPAGTEFYYNNGAYNLLGTIVKRISGQSLHDFEETNIFIPLGMTRTLVRDSMELVIPNLANGYRQDARGLHATSEVAGAVGNSGMYTTPEDLLRWEQNFDDARVGTPQTLASMQKPAVLNNGKPTQYGFGLFLMQYRGLRTVEHGGEDRGVEAYLIRFPEQRLAIALQCNSNSIDVIELKQKIADIYLEGTRGLAPPAVAEKPPAPVRLAESELKARTGLYRKPSDEGFRDIAISAQGTKLIGHSYYEGDSEFDLIPVDQTRLRAPDGTIFGFIPAHDGHQQALVLIAKDGRRLGILELVTLKPPTAELTSFAGEYRSAELEADVGVVLKNSGLVVRWPGSMETTPLLAFGKDAFVGSGVGVVKFFRDSRGEVAEFTISQYNAQDVRFVRMKSVE
jgi:CubicO group peptidase (beta-lactamase class C family)